MQITALVLSCLSRPPRFCAFAFILPNRFLIEGPRGTVLHTGDLRAEPWFLSSIQRNHFLQPYLANSSGDLRILVARREGTHAEATGLVKTLKAIYLDTACLLSPLVVPSKVCLLFHHFYSSGIFLTARLWSVGARSSGHRRTNSFIPVNHAFFHQHLDLGLRRHSQSYFTCVSLQGTQSHFNLVLPTEILHICAVYLIPHGRFA